VCQTISGRDHYILEQATLLDEKEAVGQWFNDNFTPDELTALGVVLAVTPAGRFVPKKGVISTSTSNRNHISVRYDKGEFEETIVVTAEYDALNQGPLPTLHQNSFRSGKYNEVLTTQPTTLYRVYSNDTNLLGKLLDIYSTKCR